MYSNSMIQNTTSYHKSRVTERMCVCVWVGKWERERLRKRECKKERETESTREQERERERDSTRVEEREIHLSHYDCIAQTPVWHVIGSSHVTCHWEQSIGAVIECSQTIYYKYSKHNSLATLAEGWADILHTSPTHNKNTHKHNLTDLRCATWDRQERHTIYTYKSTHWSHMYRDCITLFM